MKDMVYKIFKDCFPEIPITDELLYSLMNYDQCTIIEKRVEDQLIGFSAVRENRIILFCISPDYQRKGYGRELVQESERIIKRKGYKQIILGDTDSSLFMGALSTEEEWSKRRNYFFEKCGYTAENGCVEMELHLKDFDIDNLNITYPEGISYEYWTNPDKSELYSAVGMVDEEWVKYFKGEVTVFAAMENEKCVGFTILSFDDLTLCNNGSNRVGMVGCVGVIPGKREHGIGLGMVALATNELKKKGCDISYIHYTHLEKWYGKLGYKTIFRYWFGKKDI